MTLTDLEREALAMASRVEYPGGWRRRSALAYPTQTAPGQPLAASGLPIPRPIIATIRRTRNTRFVQFTYCGKRISRERAKELLET